MNIRAIVCLFIFLVTAGFPALGKSLTDEYPGTIELSVDATDLKHRVFDVKQRIPVRAGEFKLLLPKWLPGNHAPTGPIVNVAGLVMKGNGKRIEWRRDTLDTHAFIINIPSDVKMLEVSYQTITPADKAAGRVVMTPNMFNLQWIANILYPAGYDVDKINYKVSLQVPKGWNAFCALELESKKGDGYKYKVTDFGTLADSPVFAGIHSKTIDLDPSARIPFRLNVVADDSRFLETKSDHAQAHLNLVKQAYKIFGGPAFNHYDFLFALSKQMSGIGLEHHQSSENAVNPDYFTDWKPEVGSTELLAHELVHAWNGKYRRPADLWSANFNDPTQNSLLWVYEGQTTYWGSVLNCRSGLRTLQTCRDELALDAALYDENRPGFSWRTLQDTTNDPIMGYRFPRVYSSWQLYLDYYPGAQLMWLEVDVKLRALTDGKKSLDDFAKAFFALKDGAWKVKTYTFEDVITTLNAVAPYDWSGLLRERLDGHGSLTGGIEYSGWRLVFKDTPNAAEKAAAAKTASDADSAGVNYTYSLGFVIGKDGKITNVRWDSPAFRAGIGVGMTLVAVGDREYNKDYLEDAIKAAAKKGGAPINLMIKDFDVFRSVSINYKGGLRYPHLERIEGKPDYLTSILSPRS